MSDHHSNTVTSHSIWHERQITGLEEGKKIRQGANTHTSERGTLHTLLLCMNKNFVTVEQKHIVAIAQVSCDLQYQQ